MRDLGNAYLQSGAQPKNGSALFYLLILPNSPLTEQRFRGLSKEGLDQTADHIDLCLTTLTRARMGRPDASLIARELGWAGALLKVACRLGRARLDAGPESPLSHLAATERRALSSALAQLLDEHEPLWLARNRPGGRLDSRHQITRLKSMLEDGGA